MLLRALGHVDPVGEDETVGRIVTLEVHHAAGLLTDDVTLWAELQRVGALAADEPPTGEDAPIQVKPRHRLAWIRLALTWAGGLHPQPDEVIARIAGADLEYRAVGAIDAGGGTCRVDGLPVGEGQQQGQDGFGNHQNLRWVRGRVYEWGGATPSRAQVIATTKDG